MTNAEKYPYRIHTNHELEMMLAGSKPLAVFCHERINGFEKEDALSHQDFERHVADGVISEHIRTFKSRRPGGSWIDIDHYFFTLAGEDWRVDAYCLLLEQLSRGIWCAHLEELEGKLLGYTDEQIRYHLLQVYGKDGVARQGGNTTAHCLPRT